MKKIHTYTECLDYLFGLQRFGIKFGLKNISYLLQVLDNPHHKFKSIHIAGTNGKGSTTAILGSILKAGGYKTGIYTSPHLVDFSERIGVDGIRIPQNKIIDLTNQLIDVIRQMPDIDKGHPTYFEITTALAFQYFAEKNIDIAVVEVGMGGRLDATNVIMPELSIITTIGLEHTEILGNSLSLIAREKAGIIKPYVPVITGVQNSEALDVIRQISQENNSQLFILDKNFSFKINTMDITGNTFDYYGISKSLNNLFIPLAGEHQIYNAVLAISGIEVLRMNKQIYLDDDKVYVGLKAARWAGRLEVVAKEPLILLDGAHNPDCAGVLRKSILKFFPGKHIYFIIGILNDKDRESILKLLCPLAYETILTTIQNDRASPPEELYTLAKKYCNNIKIIPTIAGSIEYARSCAALDDVICITGSLYVLGEALKELKD
ncbi:bifunctional folylpolyglutamate synthase/dihydrofolate synthase [Candidatus Desantisbacteria bacterium]|nr:bifunctional folylpolyglutamate synthase/dihydrofolate synthase [Candidatus Desantisbacteria bacterium]